MHTIAMNSAASAPRRLPSLTLLFWDDRIFGHAARTAGFALLAGFGIHWASQPQPNAVVKVENSPMEVLVMQWAIPCGIAIAAIALLVMLRRYLWIKKVITEGASIKGMVEEMDVYSREAERSEHAPAFQRHIIRTYYATIRYTFHSVEKKVRVKLPNTPSTYQVFKDKEVELLVHDSAPTKPLISAVYRDLPRLGRR